MALVNCPECGKEVSFTAESCPHCGYAVKKHFDDIENLERRAERQRQLALQREKRASTLKIVLPIIIIVIFIVAGFLINHSVLSQRMIFTNEQAMIDYLTDYHSWKLDNDYKDEYLVFYEDNLCSLLTDGIMNGGDKIILHPKRGYFERGNEKYMIFSSGDVVNSDKTDYYKPYYGKAPFEDGYRVLNIEILSSELEDGNFKAEYKVTNNGKKSYLLISLETIITLSDDSKLALKDDFEFVSLDGNETYLRPGKSGTATAFGHDIPADAKEFEVHVKSYDTEYIFK